MCQRVFGFVPEGLQMQDMHVEATEVERACHCIKLRDHIFLAGTSEISEALDLKSQVWARAPRTRTRRARMLQAKLAFQDVPRYAWNFLYLDTTMSWSLGLSRTVERREGDFQDLHGLTNPSNMHGKFLMSNMHGWKGSWWLLVTTWGT